MPPRPCADALQPVVTGQAPSAARSHLAEGQVDLVVDDEHLVETEPVAGRAPGPTALPGLVHVRLRQQQRDVRAPGPARPSLTSPPNALLACGSSQRRPSSFATSKPMLCRRAGVARPRIAEPDQQEVDRSALAPAAKQASAQTPRGATRCRRTRRRPLRQREPRLRPRGPRRPRGALALLADERRLLLDLGLLDDSDGAVTVATTVSSRSSRAARRPPGA